MPADGEVRICVAAILTLRNEGSRTSQVLFEVDRIDDVTSPYGISVLTDPENSSHQIHTVLREKRVSIAPQEVRQVFVRCGPTIEEWFEGDQSAIWKNTFLVSAYASIEGARQNWALSFEAQLFTTNPRYMGDVTLRANVLPSTMIAELPRTYP
jgi:hypothetical protein